MWFGNELKNIEHDKVIKQNTDLSKVIKDLEGKVRDLEYQLNKLKSSIYFDKFHYTEKDLVHDRRCYVPNDKDLRRIAYINGSWEVIKEEKGSYETPEVFKEYKSTLKKDKLSKKELLEYMKDKVYVMEQGDSDNDTAGIKV